MASEFAAPRTALDHGDTGPIDAAIDVASADYRRAERQQPAAPPAQPENAVVVLDADEIQTPSPEYIALLREQVARGQAVLSSLPANDLLGRAK